MWRITRANSLDATSGRLLSRPGQSERHIRHQNRSPGGETPAYLRLPSHPAHATNVVERSSWPTCVERAVPMSSMRAIAGGHVGDEDEVREETSPESYDKYRAVALFCDSGAPGAVVDGAPIQVEGAVVGGDDRRSSQSEKVERRLPREGPTYTVSSTRVSEVSARELSVSTAPTTILHEVGTTTREGRETTGGIPCEVGGSTPSSETKKRRAPPGSGRGTPLHAHVSASRRRRNMINHPDASSAWGTWTEQQEASMQNRDRAKEHALKALPPSGVATTPVSPYNSSLRPPVELPDDFSTPSGHCNKRPGSPCSSNLTPSNASRSRSKREKKRQRVACAAAPDLAPGTCPDVGSSSAAGREEEGVASMPTTGASSDVMRDEGRETSPANGRCGGHRRHGARTRITTRRSSAQGHPEIHDSCMMEQSAPTESKAVSRSRGRGRKRSYGREECGITYPLVEGQWSMCSCCGQAHDPASRLCVACHRPGPGEGKTWRHFGPARVAEAKIFLECVDGSSARPSALLRSYQPSSDCLCSRVDCFLPSFDRYRLNSDRQKTKSIRARCPTPPTVDLTPDHRRTWESNNES
ncbi:unnamed protein product [Sphacelaria rigidula]